ncbi:archaeosortase/exosortase family protein [soil metagenome]
MKSESPVKKFGPALRFVVTFAGVYLVGNVLYGLYIEHYRPLPDPMTYSVTQQVASLLTMFGDPSEVLNVSDEPIVILKKEGDVGKTVLRVFEGCNGLNVLIVFGAFVVAFGGPVTRMLIFIFTAGIVLHLANLSRIILLYYTALYRPTMFYYFHKYFFTAILYVVVFGLWIVWTRINKESNDPVAA